MTNALHHLQVFIGSSTEGLKIARTLQAELEAATDCIVKRWDTDTFAPGSITLDELIARANSVDFAILVATGEDTVTSRGTQSAAVRDNIILEFGLFLGALGRERVYLLSVGDAKLPSDLQGLTRLIYRERPDDDIRAGLNDAVLRVEKAMAKLGPRRGGTQPNLPRGTHAVVEMVAKDALSAFQGEAPAQRGVPQNIQLPVTTTHDSAPSILAASHGEQTLKALEEEIKWLCSNATSQGWAIVKNNPTTLRLSSPKGKSFTLARKRPAGTRTELRKFVTELRANGLRVNRALQGSVEESPFG
ncbi:nucleotide-binding protein [Pseudarthrobacter sp. CC12]|uniref:nucleotide-binding protein n=1 Tax=Pseudarthrobacter sp. CC12 TaxID=3029193 RepID=UPI003267D18A